VFEGGAGLSFPDNTTLSGLTAFTLQFWVYYFDTQHNKNNAVFLPLVVRGDWYHAWCAMQRQCPSPL
jgi:hypothetical protein